MGGKHPLRSLYFLHNHHCKRSFVICTSAPQKTHKEEQSSIIKCVNTFPAFPPLASSSSCRIGWAGLLDHFEIYCWKVDSDIHSTKTKHTHTQKKTQLPRPQRKQNNSKLQRKLFSRNSYRLRIDRFSPLGFLFFFFFFFFFFSLSPPQKKSPSPEV